MAEDHETQRIIGDVVRLVVVDSVDLAAGLCVVRAGELLSGPIPWMTPAAGATRVWSPPSVGEQGLLICPEGDIAAGVFQRGIFSTESPAPSSAELEAVRFSDGSLITYDGQENRLTLQLVGAARLVAPDGLSIEADVAIAGDVTVTGKVTAGDEIATSADVKAGAVSLRTHKHSDVQAGAAQTGGPV